jgi:hypothetical protein
MCVFLQIDVKRQDLMLRRASSSSSKRSRNSNSSSNSRRHLLQRLAQPSLSIAVSAGAAAVLSRAWELLLRAALQQAVQAIIGMLGCGEVPNNREVVQQSLSVHGGTHNSIYKLKTCLTNCRLA